MNKVLVDRGLLERVLQHDFAEDCQECAIGKSEAWSELREAIAQSAEAEGVDLQRLAAEFDAAPDDAEWEPPHPIFQMARDLDRATAALSAVTAERDRLLHSQQVLMQSRNAHRDERDQLRAEVDALRKDASRLDRLDIECEAYGCEGIHEGNRWVVDGPFRTVRDAIDAAMATH